MRARRVTLMGDDLRHQTETKQTENKNVGNRAINHNKWMLLNSQRDICACNMSVGFRKIANS